MNAVIMAGLVPAISLRGTPCVPERNARDKPAHDEERVANSALLCIAGRSRKMGYAAPAPGVLWSRQISRGRRMRPTWEEDAMTKQLRCYSRLGRLILSGSAIVTAL